MAKDFHKKADGLAPTVTFGRLKNKTTIAAFTNEEWKSEGGWKRDSDSMLLNLTN